MLAACALAAWGVQGAGAAPASSGSANEATISSDQMELIHNGEQTIFTGHVILERTPYTLKADRMTRYQSTGLADAEGKVVGTWVKPKGEAATTQGDYARYNPQTEMAELWAKPGRQITVDWKDAQGTAHFQGDRGVLFLASKRVRLIDRVTGHVIPTP